MAKNNYSKRFGVKSQNSRIEPNPINFNTWDIETNYPDEPDKVILTGFYDGKEYKEYDNFDYFLGKALSKEQYAKRQYAHYGGKFDFLFMLDKLQEYDYNFDIIDTNGRIISVTAYKNEESKQNGQYWTFCDSFALMPLKLSKITQAFNVSHKKQTERNWFDNTKDDYVNKFDYFDEFREYLRYDTIGLYESIDYFQKIINSYGGEIKLTTASTSLDILKNNYIKIPIHPIDLNYDDKFGNSINCESEIRNYYFGGRTEIFKRYGEDLKYYDVNSLYPSVMLDEMPISKPYYIDGSQFNPKDTGFMRCKVTFDKLDVCPLVPLKFKLEETKKLIYPIGTFNTWLDIAMLNKAKKIGYDIEIIDGFIFETADFFSDFILDFYELRSVNTALKLISKIIMNSSYGKFAQKRLITSILRYNGFDEEILTELEPYIEQFCLYKKEKISESRNIIPSISAHITTLAQLKLYSFIEKCGYENIYYCDTDSIITSTELKTSKKLGDMKKEYDINEGVFILPKSYCITGFDEDGKEYTKDKPLIKLKGFSQTDFKFKDFYKAIFTGDISNFKYNKAVTFGFKESIKRRKKFFTHENKKHELKGFYDKRIILDDKINTRPLKVNGEQLIEY